ncbi:hypothetical protein [Deinococcus kurensis]|uniref:hypothetical protein n=1 Tax=Deinococcus kurensis TaxID=2662757 RepID=UPI001391F57B|nr:hypothetical protein [Deinococcus kurensis]
MSAQVIQRLEGRLGDHLPTFQDTLDQIDALLRDPSPGSITARKAEAQQYLTQMAEELTRRRTEVQQLSSQLSFLKQMLDTLVAQLNMTGVAMVEFSGDTYAEVLAELQTKAGNGQPFPPAQSVYGVMLLASSANTAAALQTLLGAGQAVRAPFQSAPPR